MKKIIILLSIMFLIVSCHRLGTQNPGSDSDEVYVQINDTLVYKVLWVTVSSQGGGFYMLVPNGSNVKCYI